VNRRDFFNGWGVVAAVSGLLFGAKSGDSMAAPPLIHPEDQPYQLWTKDGPVEVWVRTPMEQLTEHIKADPAYAWSWHCNLAVCAMDEGLEHAAANRAADRMMQVLFGVKASPPESYVDDRVNG
jgi:hypothetical protein